MVYASELLLNNFRKDSLVNLATLRHCFCTTLPMQHRIQGPPCKDIKSYLLLSCQRWTLGRIPTCRTRWCWRSAPCSASRAEGSWRCARRCRNSHPDFEEQPWKKHFINPHQFLIADENLGLKTVFFFYCGTCPIKEEKEYKKNLFFCITDSPLFGLA